MKVFVFGNPDIKKDSLPLKILPKLQKRFADIDFVIADPTESLEFNDDEFIILDAVQGIDDVEVIEDISGFDLSTRFSVHDYDLALDLKLLEKLGKLRKVKVIAIPASISEQDALYSVLNLLRLIKNDIE